MEWVTGIFDGIGEWIAGALAGLTGETPIKAKKEYKKNRRKYLLEVLFYSLQEVL